MQTRRSFLKTGATLLVLGSGLGMPALIRAAERPHLPYGLQSGDVGLNQAVIWAAADQPSRMHLEWSTVESFRNSQRLLGPHALESTGLTAKQILHGLPTGQRIFYRVQLESLQSPGVFSEPMVGSFVTPSGSTSDVSFVWSGDTAGQGWGINEEWGGMRIYETMRQLRPDFFIHSGDTIYADGPIQAEQQAPDGSIWKNLTTEEKSKVAETLQEFRGNFAYNLMDANVRRFNAEVPMFAQWDDHETVNNWYPGEMLISDDRYKVKSASLLAARANQAFHEFMPLNANFQNSANGIYRKISRGPLLDIFFLDMRSFRSPNGPNNQAAPSLETEFLGAEQVRWLKRELLNSQATWKVIASDMPIGMIVYDNWKDKSTFENLANGDGPVLGREFEIADLLGFMKQNTIKNVVWFTADVHYTAAHYYDPNKAQFQDFDPFWEFVSGPLNSGSFGPNEMDNTFGPQVVFTKHPDQANLPPSNELQFFGHVQIAGESQEMTVTLKDLNNQTLYTKTLYPLT